MRIQLLCHRLCRGLRRWAGRGLRLVRAERGVASVEAALIVPGMIIFMLAVVELYQYFRVVAILDRAAFSVADGIAMQPKLYDGGPCNATDHLCTYGALLPDLMQPVNYAQAGNALIRLYTVNTVGATTSWNPQPAWAKACSGAGICSDAPAGSLPAGMPPANPKDTVLVVQVFQNFEPFVISSRVWSSLGGSITLSAIAFYRPRFDDLKTLN